MVRKTKEEALATRERLLDAAQRLFREQGVTRTSLAEVATAAGMTRGAVYWHFKDKADLFRAMCDRATLPLDAHFDQAVQGASADPLGTLRSLSIGALLQLANDARAQHVFEIVFHKSELVDELAGLATSHKQRLQELHQWKTANPRLANSCREAAESLSRVQVEYLERMTDEITESADDMTYGEFVLNEFVDRYGPRLAHLNGVIQVLAQLGNNPQQTQS